MRMLSTKRRMQVDVGRRACCDSRQVERHVALSTCFLLLLSLGFAAGVGICLYHGAQQRMQYNTARSNLRAAQAELGSFRHVNATLLDLQITSDTFPGTDAKAQAGPRGRAALNSAAKRTYSRCAGSVWLAATYQYSVGGSMHTSSQFYLQPRHADRGELRHLKQLNASWHSDAAVPAFVNPDKPAVAVLSKDVPQFGNSIAEVDPLTGDSADPAGTTWFVFAGVAGMLMCVFGAMPICVLPMLCCGTPQRQRAQRSNASSNANAHRAQRRAGPHQGPARQRSAVLWRTAQGMQLRVTWQTGPSPVQVRVAGASDVQTMYKCARPV